MPNEIDKTELTALSYRFYENLYSLRVFNEQLDKWRKIMTKPQQENS